MNTNVKKHEGKYIHMKKSTFKCIFAFLVSACVCWTSVYLLIKYVRDIDLNIFLGMGAIFGTLFLIFFPMWILLKMDSRNL